jgi:hypothetical protein
MSIPEPPIQKPGDIDGLLRSYFRGQMPQSWPSPPVPVAPAISSHHQLKTRSSLIRSRWALAASVALLLLGSLLLPNRVPQDVNAENSAPGPQISSRDLQKQMEREHQQRQMHNKNKPGLGVEEGDLFPERDDSDLPLH